MEISHIFSPIFPLFLTHSQRIKKKKVERKQDIYPLNNTEWTIRFQTQGKERVKRNSSMWNSSTWHESRYHLENPLGVRVSTNKMKRDDKKASAQATAKEEGEMWGERGEKEEGRGRKEEREGLSSGRGILRCILARRSHGRTSAEFSHCFISLSSCPPLSRLPLPSHLWDTQYPSDQFLFCLN